MTIEQPHISQEQYAHETEQSFGLIMGSLALLGIGFTGEKAYNDLGNLITLGATGVAVGLITFAHGLYQAVRLGRKDS